MAKVARVRKPYWLDAGMMLEERYRIEDVVEEGGFGIVYLGWDVILRTKVAVKEYFPRELAGRAKGAREVSVYEGHYKQIFEYGLEKFLNEARTLASFNSMEGIIWVKDFFYENSIAYIIMEYVEGINLKEYVRQNGELKPVKVLEIMRPILLSLEKIHHLGLIHRDISPENIVLNEEGNAYLVDFGITRPYTGEDFKTITVFFKRGYAAEEQYREQGEQGPWTDIYALCATMYYMLTGVQPVESAQRNIKDVLVPLSSYRKLSIPENVQRAVKKGMAVDASKRYAAVGQLYKDLYEDGKRNSSILKNKIRFASVTGLCGLILGAACFFSAGGMSGKVNVFDNNIAWEKPMPPSATKAVKMSGEVNRPESSAMAEKSSESFKVGKRNEEKAAQNEKIFKIPEMKGKTETKARRLLKRMGDSSLKLMIKRVYHNKVAKNRVLKQSIRAGFQYHQGDIQEIILTVSKGKKAKKENAVKTMPPAQTKPPSPAVTPKPASKKPSQKKDKGDDYAGILPY